MNHNIKKDFMVVWKDEKGKIHKTKVSNKVASAKEAAEYIFKNRKTCFGIPYAYYIVT